MDKRKILGAGLTVILFLGAAWAFGFFNGLDSEVAELKAMRDDGFSRMGQMTDEERRAHFMSLRERAEQLSPEQRRQVFEGGQQFFAQRMNEFFAKSPAEQRKELDELIDRMEQWQGGNRGGRDGGNRPQLSQQQIDQRMKQGLDRTSPEMRARMEQFRTMLNQRRGERGLPPVQGGSRGMFGGRGRA